jgi:hypothetical protein
MNTCFSSCIFQISIFRFAGDRLCPAVSDCVLDEEQTLTKGLGSQLLPNDILGKYSLISNVSAKSRDQGCKAKGDKQPQVIQSRVLDFWHTPDRKIILGMLR